MDIINRDKYFKDLDILISKVSNDKFDCIVCLKRSGFILGATLSNKLDIPLFVQSEVKSIPDKFKNILIVDDKICTGKSIKKVINSLFILGKQTKTACLYIQRELTTSFYVEKLLDIHKMWYEI